MGCRGVLRGYHQEVETRAPCAAVVVHPLTVPDPGALRAALTARFQRQGWAPPRWCETTPEDPGTALTADAVAHGVDLVVCCGGDGTVRAVAAALVGTGVPLGVLPTGTGNLLARNLGIPRDLGPAVDVALDGALRTLDLGTADGHSFAVMAGVGFDAAMVADAPVALKSRFGWPAYVLSALRHLGDRPMVVTLRGDGGPWRTLRARGVIVGNVGELQGGSRLLPAADPADGLLDVAVLAPSGLWDWARIVGRVLSGSSREDGLLERFQVRRLELRTRRPQPHELDGDPREAVTSVTFEVAPAALVVRVPR